MPMKRTPRQRRAAEQRRRQAQQAARREEHARLVVERSGDPRFVQRRRADDGSAVYSWDAQSPFGQRIEQTMAEQRQAFRERFGRDPGPDDPIFFDPDADEPTPIGDQHRDAQFETLITAAEEAGVDPAYVKAWRELGYIVTETNRHLFSATEVEAYLDAVASYQDEAEDDEGDDSADDLNPSQVVSDGLRALVAQIVELRSPEPAWALDLATRSTRDPDAHELITLFGFGVLMSWLTGARETLGDAVAVPAVSWIADNLGEPLERKVRLLSGLLHHPQAPDLTVDQALDQVGDDVLSILLCLVAGVVATALDGDANRLAAFDVTASD